MTKLLVFPSANIRTCAKCSQALDLAQFITGDLSEKGRISSYCRKCRQTISGEIAWKKAGILNKEGSAFTMSDYDKLFQEQGGRCKICNIPQEELKKALAIDHRHSKILDNSPLQPKGNARGLLCAPCNLRIGGRENPNFVDEDETYLKNYM